MAGSYTLVKAKGVLHSSQYFFCECCSHSIRLAQSAAAGGATEYSPVLVHKLDGAAALARVEQRLLVRALGATYPAVVGLGVGGGLGGMVGVVRVVHQVDVRGGRRSIGGGHARGMAGGSGGGQGCGRRREGLWGYRAVEGCRVKASLGRGGGRVWPTVSPPNAGPQSEPSAPQCGMGVGRPMSAAAAGGRSATLHHCPPAHSIS